MNIPYLLNSLAWGMGGVFITLFFAWVTGKEQRKNGGPKLKFPKGPGLAAGMSVVATVAGVLFVLAYQVKQDDVNSCFREINSRNAQTSISLRVLADKDRSLDMREKVLERQRDAASLKLYQAIESGFDAIDPATFQAAINEAIQTGTQIDDQLDSIDSERDSNAEARKSLPTQDPIASCGPSKG